MEGADIHKNLMKELYVLIRGIALREKSDTIISCQLTSGGQGIASDENDGGKRDVCGRRAEKHVFVISVLMVVSRI